MKDYHSSHAVSYEQPAQYGFTVVDVLPFLRGRKWDERALGFVHTLRPSYIRVTRGEVKTDARTWRVTVYVDHADTILSIKQEVEIGLTGTDWENGYDASLWVDGR
jgi:hypothetical protein